MKRYPGFAALAAALAVAAMLAVTFSTGDPGEPSVTAPDPAAPTLPRDHGPVQAEAFESVGLDDDAADAAPDEEAPAVDGTVAREWGTFVKARDIRFNCRDVREVVRPVPRPGDFRRECDTRTVFEHPYERFTLQQLEQIADYDPVAAYILGYRILAYRHQRNNQSVRLLEKGLSHAMTAFMLTGEPQAFDLLVDGRHFPNRSVWSTVNGVPDEREIREKAEQYRWFKLGRNLGVIEEDDYRWQLVARTTTRFSEYFDREALDAEVEARAEQIAARRAYVTGERP